MTPDRCPKCGEDGECGPWTRLRWYVALLDGGMKCKWCGYVHREPPAPKEGEK